MNVISSFEYNFVKYTLAFLEIKDEYFHLMGLNRFANKLLVKTPISIASKMTRILNDLLNKNVN